MDQEQKDSLEWFLEFLNVDLASLDDGGRAKLSTEIAMVLGYARWNGINEYVPSEILDRYRLNQGAELQRLQQCLSIFFGEIMMKVYGAIDFIHDQEFLQIYEPLLSQLKTLSEMEPNIQATLSMQLEEKRGWDWGHVPKDIVHSVIWEETAVKRAVFRVDVVARKDESSLLYNFMLALDGVPLFSLRQCEECLAFFLHLSKRDRLYCSNQCAAKSGNRRRYQKIKVENSPAYHAELVKGRERAHVAYKKVAKRANPNVKVKRSPRKAKDNI